MPALFPILEALLISTFWYSLELFQRCSFYLLSRSKSPFFHGFLQFWKQEKVAEGQVWRGVEAFWIAKTEKQSRQFRSNVKVLITAFFDYNGMVHYEVLPEGLAVNKQCYLEVMCRFREAYEKKTPGIVEKPFMVIVPR